MSDGFLPHLILTCEYLLVGLRIYRIVTRTNGSKFEPKCDGTPQTSAKTMPHKRMQKVLDMPA